MTERFRDCCLEAIDQGATSLLLILSTCGGSTNFGFTLYTFLKSLPVPLCAINAGNIESMASSCSWPQADVSPRPMHAF